MHGIKPAMNPYRGTANLLLGMGAMMQRCNVYALRCMGMQLPVRQMAGRLCRSQPLDSTHRSIQFASQNLTPLR